MSAAARQSQPHQPPLMSVNKPESTPTSQPFPLIQVMRWFKAYCYERPEVKSTHRALFYHLLEIVDYRGNLSRFQLNREDGMAGAGIGSKDTYTAALKQLHEWGLIVYTAGANAHRAAIIEVLPQSGSVPELGRYLGRYKDATGSSTGLSTGYSTGTTKKTLDYETVDPESEGESALAQKKIIEDQAKEITALTAALAEAPHTRGGATNVATPVAEARVVPLAIEDDPYGAEPRDVEMVNEFIANHHDPEVRKHAGKGHLFWAEYAPKGWVYGRYHTPIKNWRSLIPSFQFREPTSFDHANASSKNRPASGRNPAQASWSGSSRQPLAEGLTAGPALTGTIDDL